MSQQTNFSSAWMRMQALCGTAACLLYRKEIIKFHLLNFNDRKLTLSQNSVCRTGPRTGSEVGEEKFSSDFVLVSDGWSSHAWHFPPPVGLLACWRRRRGYGDAATYFQSTNSIQSFAAVTFKRPLGGWTRAIFSCCSVVNWRVMRMDFHWRSIREQTSSKWAVITWVNTHTHSFTVTSHHQHEARVHWQREFFPFDSLSDFFPLDSVILSYNYAFMHRIILLLAS